MTLFSSIQTAKNSLLVAQLGLQVTGNNIANANTPGYIRERLILNPQPPQRYGGHLVGLGVDAEGVVQVIDRFLEERLRRANSDLAGGEALEHAYVQLEGLIGELSDTDLSTSLTDFFASIHDVLNQPESVSVRNLAVLEGQALTDDIRRLDSQAREIHQDLNGRIISTADRINALLEDIAKLNGQIVEAENSDVSASDAVGLRDKRSKVLAELASIVDIRTVEQEAGDVTVFSGGDYLVAGVNWRPVKVVHSTENGLSVAEIRITELDAPLVTTSGELAGLLAARDTVLGGFIEDLNSFTRTLLFEFNKVYAGGQGLAGYSSATSEFAVSDVAAALNQAGLEFSPVHGGFQILVKNEQTGLTKTTDIQIDLDGLATDTSLTDLAAQLDAVDGIAAIVTPEGKLQIASDSNDVSFAFANDTSGILAALGINTFFSGSSASDIGINAALRANPRLFAASAGGIGEDSANATRLATLLTEPLASHNGDSLAILYDRLTGDVAQGAAGARATTEGYRVFQRTLEGQHLAITGVNIDEEAVQMIAWQRAFQASAKVISTINELLETLVNL
ncbi:MAG TPA: flagellar hook-associated protein FlgK [Pirellulaceae bacterium]|nr:flagellar hook-associated protein FlgK [Pirellulaceae bacterium]